MRCRFWWSCRPCPSPRPLHNGGVSMGEDPRGGKPPLTLVRTDHTGVSMRRTGGEIQQKWKKKNNRQQLCTWANSTRVSSMCYSETRASAHACMDLAHLDPVCGPPPSGLRLPRGSPSLLTWSKQGLNLI